MSPTVALLDLFHPAIAEAIRTGLPAGWQPRFAASKDPADQRGALAVADVAFVMAAPVGADLIAAAPRLRFIQKLGAGIDRIDLEACRARAVAVARIDGGNAIPVAEHTVMLMLAACRRLPLIDRRTRAGEWVKEEARGIHRQLHGKRVGLVGFGAIGRQVARLLSGFAVELVYYDPAAAPPELEREVGATRLPLDALLASSDVVSLHLPLTTETAGLLDAGRIAAMKPGAILVNCARGGLVDEAALHRALADGHLFAAAVDCFAAEPPGVHPLFALDNTVVTSHLAGATLDNFASVLARAVANAEALLAGRPLPERDAVLQPAGV